MSNYLLSKNAAIEVKAIWTEYLKKDFNTHQYSEDFYLRKHVTTNAVANLLYLLLTQSKTKFNKSWEGYTASIFLEA